MNKNPNQHSLWIAIATLTIILTLACNLSIDLGTGTAPQPTPFISPTSIPPQVVVASPTSPPPPLIIESTPTLGVPAPQEDSQIMADVQEYYGKGYLPYQNGTLTSLPDYSNTQPSMDIHDLTRTGAQSQDFALWADIELNSSGSTTYPNYTGCGFAYRAQNNNTGYTAILTNDYVRMGACSSNMLECELFGTLFYGTGEVNISNNTKAQFSMTVNRDRAHVLVDGILVGQYGLFTAKLLGIGDLYYDVVSNYAGGYWSSCKITNVKLWESHP